MMADNPFRNLPSVSKLLGDFVVSYPQLSQSLLVEIIRQELATARRLIESGRVVEDLALHSGIQQQISRALRPRYGRVINATGIVLHTNLGRAPMSESAVRAAAEAASGYISLELDLATGERRSRQQPVRELICRLTGAESATVVNNCAAATVITLRAIATGKEVIVSRGQLVEIGGGFRIPEILATSGAILREIGTTNITRLRDYETALGSITGAILRVHTSNYRISGFTKSVNIIDLAKLGNAHNIPVIDDVGSGAAIEFGDEPTIREGLDAGADLVLFSGDKLLGAPQAGIIAGRARWIQAIERDPLMRAFRCDKMTLAALEATLKHYLGHPHSTVPALRMLTMPFAELQARSESFVERLKLFPDLTVSIQEDFSFAGGGSLADRPIPTVVIAISCKSINESQLAAGLRAAAIPVMSRIKDGKVLLDLRTVFIDQEPLLVDAIQSALQPLPGNEWQITGQAVEWEGACLQEDNAE